MMPLFVGLNPSKHPGADWKNNPSFSKLYDWIERIGIRHFSFVNVSHIGGVFDKNTIDVAFLGQVIDKHNGAVIALGREVAHVLQHMRISHFKMPHPSPLNRLLNDTDYEEEMLYQLKCYLEVEESIRKERKHLKIVNEPSV